MLLALEMSQLRIMANDGNWLPTGLTYSQCGPNLGGLRSSPYRDQRSSLR
jgi:hypothetical protein